MQSVRDLQRSLYFVMYTSTLEWFGSRSFPLIPARVGDRKGSSSANMSATNLLPIDGASPAPRAQWADHQHTAHVVQFYGEDRFLLDELSRFIGDALGAGKSAVVIATEQHRDGLNQRLQNWGLDTARAVAQGRYLSLDASDTLTKIMHDGSPDPTR